MARISTPPIPASMYRHFAAVTLCATAVLAMLVDSEGRQAHAASPQGASKPPVASAEPATVPRFAQEEEFSLGDLAGGFGSEFSFAGGGHGRLAPDMHFSDWSQVEPGSEPAKRSIAPASYGLGGLSPEELARLSQEEREALEMLSKASNARNNSAARWQEIARLRRASLARSGSDTSDDL